MFMKTGLYDQRGRTRAEISRRGEWQGDTYRGLSREAASKSYGLVKKALLGGNEIGGYIESKRRSSHGIAKQRSRGGGRACFARNLKGLLRKGEGPLMTERTVEVRTNQRGQKIGQLD